MTGALSDRRGFLAAGGALALRLFYPRGAEPVSGFLRPAGIETGEPLVFRPAVSGDGEILAFASGSADRQDVWIRSRAGARAFEPVHGTRPTRFPRLIRSLDAEPALGVVWMEEALSPETGPSRLSIWLRRWEGGQPERLPGPTELGAGVVSSRRLRQCGLCIYTAGRRVIVTIPGFGVHGIHLDTGSHDRVATLADGASLSGIHRTATGGIRWFAWDTTEGESVRTLNRDRWEITPPLHLLAAELSPLTCHTVLGSMCGQHAVIDLHTRRFLWLGRDHQVRDELPSEVRGDRYSPVGFIGPDDMLLENVMAGFGRFPAAMETSRLVIWTARDKGGLPNEDQAH